MSNNVRALADNFLRFSTASVSQFHVVEESMRRLREAGYTRISGLFFSPQFNFLKHILLIYSLILSII